jgi:hypothetical protein
MEKTERYTNVRKKRKRPDFDLRTVKNDPLIRLFVMKYTAINAEIIYHGRRNNLPPKVKT